MSGGHYSLDVNPGLLRSVARQIGELREQLRKSGRGAGDQPDAIGEAWTGSAATDIKGAMTDLGTLIGTFDGRLQPVAEAARTLATTYDEALDETIPSLNRRWREANEAYDDAVRDADKARERGTDAASEDGRTPTRADRNELDSAHDTAVGTAGSDRATAHRNLDYEYGQMKQWLAGETRKLETALEESGPVGVTDDQVDQWNAGQGPTIDPSALFGSLPLMQQRVDRLAEIELEQQREEAREQSREDIDALNQAIEDDDPEAVQAALDAIGEHKDDEVYAAELIDQLGAEGIQDVYLAVDDMLTGSETDMETIWPSLEGFNDTVALGISGLSDEAMAAGLRTFMDKDYGPKMWALIASSDNADGRINAIALAHHSEIYNAALSNAGAMPGLFPQVFNYAYGDNDMLDQLDERSSGEDLANVLEHATQEQIDDIMFRMHNVQVPGGTMNEDEYQHLADLWGETVNALHDHYTDAAARGDEYDLSTLIEVLKARNSNTQYPYGDMLDGYTEPIVRDSGLMDQLLKDMASDRVTPSDVKDLIHDSGVPVDEIIAGVMQHQLDAGEEPESVARNLGTLLRADDIIGDDFNWGGVVKSLVESGITAAAATNPVTGALSGPTLGLFNALTDELTRMEELDEAWDSSAEKNEAQDLLAFTLYVQHYGEPDGFQDFVNDQGGNIDEPSQLITRYLDRMQARGGEDWEEMRLLINTIDETRDEQ